MNPFFKEGMLKTTLLLVAASVGATWAGILLPSKQDVPANLAMGTLLSPEYDQEAVDRDVAEWMKGGDSRNIWELSGLREGDIIDDIGVGRNVKLSEKSKWPNNTVVYKYEPGWYRNEKIKLHQAMDMISNGTCIKFRKATPRDNDYAYLIYNSSSCNSFVGRHGGPQVVHLGRGGCMHVGTIAHELLHAIGLDHMQNSFNRDDYVHINFTNIPQKEWHNFEKDDPKYFSDYGLPYDYDSIMHYSQVSFTKWGHHDAEEWGPEYWTVVPHPDPYVKIGQRDHVSQIDYMKVNIKYKCPGYENGQHMVIQTHTEDSRL